MPENTISAEIESSPNHSRQAALALQQLGFRILHIGPTISVQAPQSLWESTFNVSFQPQQKTLIQEIDGSDVTYPKAAVDHIQIPEQLQTLVTGVMFVEPPEFF
ncbi:hypothetical protein BJP34_24470 [Moorena producens PAL-8-15-08-1]|uniref:Uncharacterized protein n=2 Tax=Moorena TaxID=1155738 RepID=A0A1D8TXA1_9CYAN|nr:MULTISPECIES: hypothetical protein [Moorena]AOX02175.1 hypothetical protein BJP34_24470 [Moorena producens PAL-8-15-08-1]OLT61651.1 hypothetical protein BJP37_24140 [Moorena bouillonii PNG]